MGEGRAERSVPDLWARKDLAQILSVGCLLFFHLKTLTGYTTLYP
jgi:hypothetical protein